MTSWLVILVNSISTNCVQLTPTGDCSEVEKLSKSVKISAKYIDSIKTSDLITDYLLLKLKEYMNLQK